MYVLSMYLTYYTTSSSWSAHTINNYYGLLIGSFIDKSITTYQGRATRYFTVILIAYYHWYVYVLRGT